jgi:hypothetical protein
MKLKAEDIGILEEYTRQYLYNLTIMFHELNEKRTNDINSKYEFLRVI